MEGLVAYFRDKRVLVTGHTGFKGSWLTLWLAHLGAEVYGYALAPPTVPSNFEVSHVRALLRRHWEADVRDRRAVRQVFEQVEPDFVFHLAAQSLVRESYRMPADTIEVNVLGTVNVLEAVRLAARPCAVVVVTSDKCYENSGQIWGYREGDPLGGDDPYSSSKAAAEVVAAAYRRSFFGGSRATAAPGIRVATSRAGNVIGGGDWARDRIMTDCIASLCDGVPIRMRNPRATRPWQHVLDPVGGYLRLAARMACPDGVSFSGAWNFGPSVQSVRTVRELVQEVVRCWGAGKCEDATDSAAPLEAGHLALNCDQAYHLLGWQPVWDFSRSVQETVRWFQAWHKEGKRMQRMCMEQIESYVHDAKAIMSPDAARAMPGKVQNDEGDKPRTPPPDSRHGR